MEPAHAKGAENVIKIKILRRSFGNRRIGTVAAAYGATDTKAPFGEVQTIAADTADSVRLHPFDKGGIYAALHDKIFHQFTDFIIGKGGNCRRTQPKAFSQTADHIIFTAAFPGPERTGCTNTTFTRIQAKHNLSQAYCIVTAFSSRF